MVDVVEGNIVVTEGRLDGGYRKIECREGRKKEK